jgi:hypothetical protein
MQTVTLPPPANADSSKTATMLRTANTNIAAFLSLLGDDGVAPYKVLKGPERTAGGSLITKWDFTDERGHGEDVVLRWAKPETDGPMWSQLTDREKGIVINFVSAFCSNLKSFIAETKKD